MRLTRRTFIASPLTLGLCPFPISSWRRGLRSPNRIRTLFDGLSARSDTSMPTTARAASSSCSRILAVFSLSPAVISRTPLSWTSPTDFDRQRTGSVRHGVIPASPRTAASSFHSRIRTATPASCAIRSAWTTPISSIPNRPCRFSTLDQPYPNHNGGHSTSVPDGYLYSASGMAAVRAIRTATPRIPACSLPRSAHRR